MASKSSVYVEISDASLKEQLFDRLSDDWSIRWRFITRDENKMTPEETDIAVIDNPSIMKHIDKRTTVVFMGVVDDDSAFFTTVDKADADALFRSVKRAFSYREITSQNAESPYQEKTDQYSLESIAHSLSARVHQLMRQSEMRIALVDQMPVGVLGVDDEDNVVLANPKAIETLSYEDIPIWGMNVRMMLSDAVGDFIKNEDAHEIEIERYGEKIIVRKAPFVLDDSYAGTILVVWNPNEHKEGVGTHGK